MSDDVKKNQDEAAKKPESKKSAVKPAATKPAPAKPATAKKSGLATPVWIVIVVVALVAGVLCGHYLLSTESSLSLDGRTTLSESELDSTIARYTYDGTTVNITAREVLSSASTLDVAVNDDGTYNVPAPSDILTYAQNEVVFSEADKRGITVTDEEVDTFAEENFGTSDYASIAEQYSDVDEEGAKNVIQSYALMAKLRDAVVTTTLPDQPTQPTEPEEGADETPTAEYASYIINLLGDEWDSEAGTWARTDGDYYATLSGYEITNDSATYAAASAAYQVAYTKYSTAATQMSEEWTTFTRSLLSNASLEIGTLATPASN